MKIKIKTLALFIGVSLSASAFSDSLTYKIRTVINEDLSSWNAIPPKYTDWTNKGNAFDCEQWEPSSSTVNIGVQFLRSRNCSVNQERFKTVLEKDSFSQKTIEKETVLEKRIGLKLEEGSAHGEKDYIVNTTNEEWSGWESNGEVVCHQWYPSSSDVEEGKSFAQTRHCIQPTKRFRDLNDNWKSGRVTLNSTSEELGSIETDKTQNSVGTKIVRNMCVDILNRGQSIGNGVYTVDPDGDGPISAKNSYCLMSQGGWTLYDSFGTAVKAIGHSPATYNAKNINSLSAITSAGYQHNLGAINSGGYYLENNYMSFFLSGDPEGYIRKTMPDWVSSVRIDASGKHYPGSNKYTFGSSSYVTGANAPRMEKIMNGKGIIEMREGILPDAAGIIWVDALWVK